MLETIIFFLFIALLGCELLGPEVMIYFSQRKKLKAPPPVKMLRTPYEEHLLDIELGIIPADAPFEGEKTFLNKKPPSGPAPGGRRPSNVSAKPDRTAKCTANTPYKITDLGDGKTLSEYRACYCATCNGRVPSAIFTSKQIAPASPSQAIPGWENHITTFTLSSGEKRYGYTCPKCSGWWVSTMPMTAAGNSIGHGCTLYKPNENGYSQRNRTTNPGYG